MQQLFTTWQRDISHPPTGCVKLCWTGLWTRTLFTLTLLQLPLIKWFNTLSLSSTDEQFNQFNPHNNHYQTCHLTDMKLRSLCLVQGLNFLSEGTSPLITLLLSFRHKSTDLREKWIFKAKVSCFTHKPQHTVLISKPKYY